MTRLPNTPKAIVPVSKVEGYLLNFEHFEGKTKAMFFRKFGDEIAQTCKAPDVAESH
ncbi:DUF6883 domain-containing protein [Dyadobacter sp. 676]|uniref:DUF6883 domain-containing protein n=1 Tax=Dyadobacter sp. 676 TaxID=3088362 RepID=A0AAU8FJ54_9BACT